MSFILFDVVGGEGGSVLSRLLLIGIMLCFVSAMKFTVMAHVLFFCLGNVASMSMVVLHTWAEYFF